MLNFKTGDSVLGPGGIMEFNIGRSGSGVGGDIRVTAGSTDDPTTTRGGEVFVSGGEFSGR
eukprot:CAMPEP_0171679834 /NCGR_PEP_ID=MMETSP0990-20121206/56476_1 /TAXON_ID=483369 /ORGANISM="non described non described, Strain CCMP2098" /LENGTH=60 /DNA_ID=CAMNT_0012266701 /DNA_START=1 /DNA_END=179 /DNA_ORIENTATION=-